MLKIFLFFFLILSFISSVYSQKSSALKEAKEGRYYGGTLKLNETEAYASLFPPAAYDNVSRRIIPYIYEGLIEYNTKDLTLRPSLAQSWTLSEDSLTYTFVMQDNVYFQDDAVFPGGKGRLLNAEDVKSCLQFLCSKDTLNKNAYLLNRQIKGGLDYYEGKTNSIEGIKVLDALKIQIQLNYNSKNFLYILADPVTYIYPSEYFNKYSKSSDIHHKALGTGPFLIQKNDESNALILKKNEKYYRKDQYGNKLPFLNGVKVSFIADKNLEVEELTKGNLDMMYRLPPEYANEILDQQYYRDPDSRYSKFNIEHNWEYCTQSLWFSFSSFPYNNLSFRRAIGHGFNSNIVEDQLNLDTYGSADHGVVPRAFNQKDYETSKVIPYYYHTDSAVLCLKRSGFKNDKPLVLKIYSDGGRNVAAADELKKEIYENLGLNIDIVTMSLAELIKDAASGKEGMYLLPVVGRYPSPQSFLEQFYGKNATAVPSYGNLLRYSNPVFDKNYEAYLHEKNETEAMKALVRAEKVLIRDGAVSPIWVEKGYRLITKKLKGLYMNEIEYWNLREVYFLK